VNLSLGGTTEPVADLLAEVGHPGAQRSWCHAQWVAYGLAPPASGFESGSS